MDNPRTHAEREAAERADEAPPPMAGGSGEDDKPCRTCGARPRAPLSYVCAPCLQTAEQRAHAATLAKAPAICPVCHDEPTELAGVLGGYCRLINQGRHPMIPSTPILIAGGDPAGPGAPADAARCAICKTRPVNPDDGVLCDPCFAHYNSHGDEPCPTCPPFTEHTHPCPTCHHERSCACTGFVPGEPLECATCSNCRGW